MNEFDSRPETYKHISTFQSFLRPVIQELLVRNEMHDRSKLESPEKEVFDLYTPQLASLQFNSVEYNECRDLMKPALDHHYAVNRHHPEHFSNGINDMTLIDLIEMLCDWKSSSLRLKTGDLYKSLLSNQKRFGYSDELLKILLNTAKELGMI